jgi:gamma-glutamyltranspeptidase/glutathione hydrolase
MVNSNYEHFGTGFIPFHCGFTLQNRGCNFVLHDVTHPNILAPHKRPYHTIIPAITTFADSRLLHSTFTVMGGFMQPQGHVQMLVNMLCHGMNPQQALDAPRFCIDAHTDAEKEATSRIFVEDSKCIVLFKALSSLYLTANIHTHIAMNSAFVDKLKTFGHVIEVLSGYKRCMFGRGQIILKDPQSGVLCAGSDGRADGCAMGW